MALNCYLLTSVQRQETLAKNAVDKREIEIKAQQAEELKEMTSYQLKALADLQPGARVSRQHVTDLIHFELRPRAAWLRRW